MRTFSSFIFNLFSLDKRSLALSRIIIGFIIIGDCLNRITYITQHYSDNGILPRYLMIKYFYYENWISFHCLFGNTIGELFLFIIHFILCIFMIIGYKTQLSIFLLWIFTCSLQFRNILILHGGDTLLRLNLLYFCFLPMGDYYSIDYLYKYKYKKTKYKFYYSISNIATISFILHLSQMYFWNYMNKYGPTWNIDYTAIYYALQMEYFQTYFGHLLLLYTPSFLYPIITRLIMIIEGYFWLLFFFPYKNEYIRCLGIFIYFIMHIIFSLSLSIGLFSYITLSSLIVIIPSIFWDYINILYLKYIIFHIKDIKIYYNPNNTLDNISYFLFNSIIKCDYITILSNKSEWKIQRINNQKNIVIIISILSFFYCKILSFILYNIHKLIKPYKQYNEELNINYTFYQFINDLRYYSFVKRLYNLIHILFIYSSKLWILLPILFIIWSQLWCISLYNNFSFYPPFYSIGTALHLDSHWDMFAPDPTKEDHHIILEGKLSNNTKLDLFKNYGIINWKGGTLTLKPSNTYKNDIHSHRWAKFYENLLGHQSKDKLQDYFLLYCCKEWQIHNPNTILETISLKVGYRIFSKPYEKLDNEYIFSKIILLKTKQCISQKQNTWKNL